MNPRDIAGERKNKKKQKKTETETVVETNFSSTKAWIAWDMELSDVALSVVENASHGPGKRTTSHSHVFMTCDLVLL